MKDERIWLLDIAALDAADTPVTLRFGSSGYIDTAKNYYESRIAQPALFTVSGYGAILQSSKRSGYGEAVLTNADGGLNYLADYAIDGRAVTLRLVNEDGSITPILRATATVPAFNGTKVSISLRDPQQVLQTPHPLGVYGGTNALPDGVDGLPTDIKGQYIPRVLGRVRNLTPILVNTARYIYQFHDGADAAASAVYDRGIALTRGADYANIADMMANAPAPGQFRVFQGYFRVGSVPTGTVTVDADATATALGDVFALICVQAGQAVNTTDTSALNSIGDVGIYLNSQQNTSDLLDLLANSAGAFWSFDALGNIRIQQLVAPGTAALDLPVYQQTSIARTATGAGSNGLPVWSVTLNADRVETTQTDLAGAVQASVVSRLGVQTRQAIVTTPATIARHPLAAQFTLDTALRNVPDALTQATRIAALLGVRRDSLQVILRLDATTAALISFGLVVNLISPYLGYSAGRKLVVIGYTVDARLSRVTLNLWG